MKYHRCTPALALMLACAGTWPGTAPAQPVTTETITAEIQRV